MTTTRTQDAKTTLAQIGRGNVLAISGGRASLAGDTLVLPVAHGYRVEVDLAANDTYTVRRVFVRGARRFIKGERAGVYCEELGEVAYRASCYLDEWATA